MCVTVPGSYVMAHRGLTREPITCIAYSCRCAMQNYIGLSVSRLDDSEYEQRETFSPITYQDADTVGPVKMSCF
jgi:hypothetical protein